MRRQLRRKAEIGPMDSSRGTDRFVILVADDEDVIRKTTSAILERDGYHVLTADSGQQALKVLQEFFGKVHLVLCSINMPAPNGLKLRNLILRHRPGIIVVLLTGDTSLSGIPTGVPILPKPFTVNEFRQRVRQWLGVEADD